MFQSRDIEKGLENQAGAEAEKTDSCGESRTQTQSSPYDLTRNCSSSLKLVLLTFVLILIFFVWYFFGTMYAVELIIIAVIAFFAAGGGYRWFRIFYKTLPRDLT